MVASQELAKEWGVQYSGECRRLRFIETRLTQAKEAGEQLSREAADIVARHPAGDARPAFKLNPRWGRAGTNAERPAPSSLLLAAL